MKIINITLTILLSANLLGDTIKYKYITSDEAVHQALINNDDLKIERIVRDIAEKRILLAESEFNTVLRASYRYEAIDTPQNTRQFIATGGGLDLRTEPRIFSERNHEGEIKVTTKFRSGSILEFGTELNVLRNDLNAQVAPTGSSLFHPEFETFTGFTFIQPLWKGRGVAANSHLIESAISEKDAATILYKIKSLATAAETTRRYNSLYYAGEMFSYTAEFLREVKAQQLQYEDLLEAGKITQNQLLEFEVFALQVEDELVRSRNNLREKESLLSNILSIDSSQLRLIAKSPVNENEGRSYDKERSIKTALKNRLDRQYYEKLLDASEEKLKHAIEEKKFTLNMVTRAGFNGLGGSYDISINNAFSSQAPELSVGLEFSKSLTNCKNCIEVQIAEKRVASDKIKLKASSSAIKVEVVTFWHKLEEFGGQKKVFAKRSAVIDQLILSAEELALTGEGDTLELLELQKQKYFNNVQQINLQENLSSAHINLQLATGQIL